MLELMKKYYEQVQALKKAYDAADDRKDEAGKAAAREQYHQWKETVQGCRQGAVPPVEGNGHRRGRGLLAGVQDVRGCPGSRQ